MRRTVVYIDGFTGRPFTEDNVGDALATRDILSELRGAGTYTAGPPPFEKRDRSRFLQALDTAIQAIRQQRHKRNAAVPAAGLAASRRRASSRSTLPRGLVTRLMHHANDEQYCRVHDVED